MVATVGEKAGAGETTGRPRVRSPIAAWTDRTGGTASDAGMTWLQVTATSYSLNTFLHLKMRRNAFYQTPVRAEVLCLHHSASKASREATAALWRHHRIPGLMLAGTRRPASGLKLGYHRHNHWGREGSRALSSGLAFCRGTCTAVTAPPHSLITAWKPVHPSVASHACLSQEPLFADAQRLPAGLHHRPSYAPTHGCFQRGSRDVQAWPPSPCSGCEHQYSWLQGTQGHDHTWS